LGLGLTKSESAFYLLLAPIRLAEWLLIIWLFYGRKNPDLRRLVVYAVLGSLWSYVLDLPAILAVFILPAGAWICCLMRLWRRGLSNNRFERAASSA